MAQGWSEMDVAKAALSFLGPRRDFATTPELLPCGISNRLSSGRTEAIPVLRAAVAAACSDSVLTWPLLGCLAAGEVFYEAARRCALDVLRYDYFYLGASVLPDLIEASVRCGGVDRAEATLSRLSERARSAARTVSSDSSPARGRCSLRTATRRSCIARLSPDSKNVA